VRSGSRLSVTSTQLASSTHPLVAKNKDSDISGEHGSGKYMVTQAVSNGDTVTDTAQSVSVVPDSPVDGQRFGVGDGPAVQPTFAISTENIDAPETYPPADTSGVADESGVESRQNSTLYMTAQSERELSMGSDFPAESVLSFNGTLSASFDGMNDDSSFTASPFRTSELIPAVNTCEADRTPIHDSCDATSRTASQDAERFPAGDISPALVPTSPSPSLTFLTATALSQKKAVDDLLG
jgi:hypothetical protein